MPMLWEVRPVNAIHKEEPCIHCKELHVPLVRFGTAPMCSLCGARRFGLVQWGFMCAVAMAIESREARKARKAREEIDA